MICLNLIKHQNPLNNYHTYGSNLETTFTIIENGIIMYNHRDGTNPN